MKNVIFWHSLRFRYAFFFFVFIRTYTNTYNYFIILLSQICGHTESNNISFFFILIVNAKKTQIKFCFYYPRHLLSVWPLFYWLVLWFLYCLFVWLKSFWVNPFLCSRDTCDSTHSYLILWVFWSGDAILTNQSAVIFLLRHELSPFFSSNVWHTVCNTHQRIFIVQECLRG